MSIQSRQRQLLRDTALGRTKPKSTRKAAQKVAPSTPFNLTAFQAEAHKLAVKTPKKGGMFGGKTLRERIAAAKRVLMKAEIVTS